MVARRGGARKTTIWFPVLTATGTAFDLIANSAQATAFDFAIEHPGTAQDYSGAIFGVRIWASPYEAMTGALQLQLVLMKLPQGLSIPSVTTAATLKQNEQYIWAQTLRDFQSGITSPGPSQDTLLMELASARRFAAGDRLVMVGINRGPAGGATQELFFQVDAYIMPD